MKIFNDTRILFRQTIRGIIAEEITYEIKEAAFPSYAHGNPLIDFLFWRRLRIAYKTCISKGNQLRILDFGCGSGVMTYMLAANGHNVLGVDTEFRPLNKVRSRIVFPLTAGFSEGDLVTMNIDDNAFDIIVALDVLEHIEDLSPYLKFFNRVLKKDGILVISGPTENRLYKIGRKLAGKEFTGEYHHKTIRDIRHEMQDYFSLGKIRKLIWPFTLFEVFSSRPRK